MKNSVSLCLCGLLLFTGCTFRIGKDGVSAASITPPAHAIVSVSGRSYGVMIGQNAATQTPEVSIGVKSFTYTRVPTGTNIAAPGVESGFDLDQAGFSTGIHERFSTR